MSGRELPCLVVKYRPDLKEISIRRNNVIPDLNDVNSFCEMDKLRFVLEIIKVRTCFQLIINDPIFRNDTEVPSFPISCLHRYSVAKICLFLRDVGHPNISQFSSAIVTIATINPNTAGLIRYKFVN